MATKKNQNDVAVNQNDLPEGYSDVTRVDSVGWFCREEGAHIEGLLLGRHTLKDGSEYYQIKTLSGSDVTSSGDNVALKKGDVVNVGKSSQLDVLDDLLDKSKEHMIFIRVIAKEKLDGGRSYWRHKIGAREATSQDLAKFGG